MTACNFCTQKGQSSMNNGFKRTIGTDEGQTISIKVSYNKGIHTIVIGNNLVT